MGIIENYIDHVIGKEGGYSDHPSDKGGKTMWGITEAVAREEGYLGAMKDLPRPKAFAIYRSRYVEKTGFARIAEISEPIALELIDTGVNMGPSISTLILQRALNGMNRQGTDYADIGLDGSIAPTGPSATAKALDRYLDVRGDIGERVMMRLLNCVQGERYLDLCEKRQKNEDFLFGWVLNRVGV